METKSYASGLKIALAFFGLWVNQTAFSQKVHLDTLTQLNNPSTKEAVYQTPEGYLYKVKFMNDPFSEVATEGILSNNCADSTFAGQARKGAKTSIVGTKTEDFATVSALLNALAKDAVVRSKLTSRSARIAEENHNVRFLKDTYLFAFKKESDNDYHIIIGDNKSAKKATLLNVEVSGLSGSNKQISNVRKAFERQFVNVCSSSYMVFAANPIKIQIEGSTFFDVDHKPGQIGPVGFQPKTSWEIHPISKIVFLK